MPQALPRRPIGGMSRHVTEKVNGWTVPGFTHVRELGNGAAGRVVLAVDDLTQTKVAIRYLDRRLREDEDFLAVFRDTARKLSQLEDPNVVDFYDFVESSDGAAVVMERIDGVALRRMLAAQGPTGPLAALALLGGLLAGLAAAHERGVVHGSVRPSNVLVDGEGNGRLADFGLTPAEIAAQAAPIYAAPELWDGADPGVGSDLYAATVIFFECLTGRPPFSARGQSGYAKAHREAPIPVEEVPGPLRDLIAMGMAKEPEKRPQSAADLLGAVEEAAIAAYGLSWEAQGRGRLTELAAQAATLPEPKPSRATTPKGNPITPRSRPARGRLVVAVIAMLVIVGGVVGAASLYKKKDDAPEPTPANSGQPSPAGPSGQNSALAATLADKVDKAVARTPNGSFTFQRTGGGATKARGTFRLQQGTVPSYSRTVSGGTKPLRKSVRAVLVGTSAYVQAGKKWQSSSVASGGGRGYAALAQQARGGSAAGNVTALLKASTAFNQAGQIYRGFAEAATLEQYGVPMVAQMASAAHVKRVAFSLQLDGAGLPVQLRIRIGNGPRAPMLHTTYSGWGRAGTIAAPH